jgi:hypothetical protein
MAEKFSVSFPTAEYEEMERRRGDQPRSTYLARLVRADAAGLVAQPRGDGPAAPRRAVSSAEARAGARATPKAKQ